MKAHIAFRSQHVCRCEYRCGIFRDGVSPCEPSTLMRRKHVLVPFSWDGACKPSKRCLLALALCSRSLNYRCVFVFVHERERKRDCVIWWWKSTRYTCKSRCVCVAYVYVRVNNYPIADCFFFLSCEEYIFPVNRSNFQLSMKQTMVFELKIKCFIHQKMFVWFDGRTVFTFTMILVWFFLLLRCLYTGQIPQ